MGKKAKQEVKEATSSRGRNIRTFLMFLVISILIWQTEKLRQTYPEETSLNIVCKNIPEGYVTPHVLDKSVNVRLEGDGFSLVRMYVTNSRNLMVDVSSMPRLNESGKSWAVFVTRKLASNKTDLPERVRITDVFTDTVMIPLLTVKKKKVPVVVQDNVSLLPQYIYSAPRRLTPDSVWVTATNDVVDTMKAVYTAVQQPETLNDTLIKELPLILPDLASASCETVTVEYDVEPFSEKKMQIPIEPVNVTPGYTCRIFPPNAKVTFYVGLSKFEAADESKFSIVADLSKIRPGDQASRVRVSMGKSPSFIQNVSFSPAYAEFILEKKK